MNIRSLFKASGQRRDWGRFSADLFVSLFVIPLVLLGAPAEAGAKAWGFAWEPGVIIATPKGDPFVFRLTAAYDYSKEFSVGPSFYLSPSGDNAMYSGTLNAQFHVGIQKIRISPFLGIGLVHRKTKHDDDTALMVPTGLSVDYPIGETLYLVGTFGVNLHDGIELEDKVDDASIGLTAGISYNP